MKAAPTKGPTYTLTEGDAPDEAMFLEPEPPVRVHLVIDAGQIPWDTFQALDRGSLLSLGLSAQAVVAELQVEGHPFARAELVALADGLAVRIASIGDGG